MFFLPFCCHQNVKTIYLLCLPILQLGTLDYWRAMENERLNAITHLKCTYLIVDCWWLSMEMLANKCSNKCCFSKQSWWGFSFLCIRFSALIRHHFETLQMCQSWRKVKIYGSNYSNWVRLNDKKTNDLSHSSSRLNPLAFSWVNSLSAKTKIITSLPVHVLSGFPWAVFAAP